MKTGRAKVTSTLALQNARAREQQARQRSREMKRTTPRYVLRPGRTR